MVNVNCTLHKALLPLTFHPWKLELNM